MKRTRTDVISLLDRTVAAVYSCEAHKRVRGESSVFNYYIWFLLRFHADLTVEGLGQYPSQDAKIDSRILPLLADQRKYYGRGLACEKEGFGIGASAYYRRVVGNIITKLLDELRELIPEGDKGKYKAALSTVESDHRATVKIGHALIS